MDFKVLEAEHEGRVFRIEEDLREVGAYLLVYEDGRCVFRPHNLGGTQKTSMLAGVLGRLVGYVWRHTQSGRKAVRFTLQIRLYFKTIFARG